MWHDDDYFGQDGDGCDNELQRAFALSRMDSMPLPDKNLAEVLEAGLFAVVCVATVYCPRTDAILGSHRSLVSSHATYHDAEEALADQVGCDEVWFVVVPERPLPRTVPCPALDNSEIPF